MIQVAAYSLIPGTVIKVVVYPLVVVVSDEMGKSSLSEQHLY